MFDADLPPWRRAQAAKFVIHFIGDLHQPLHNEDVSRGGNGIYVLWDGKEFNLHHVWDTSIAEKWIGGIRGKPYPFAKRWATQLAVEITDGKFADVKDAWLKDINLSAANDTAMIWARESNAYVCTHGKLCFPWRSTLCLVYGLTKSISRSSSRRTCGYCRQGTRRSIL